MRKLTWLQRGAAAAVVALLGAAGATLLAQGTRPAAPKLTFAFELRALFPVHNLLGQLEPAHGLSGESHQSLTIGSGDSFIRKVLG